MNTAIEGAGPSPAYIAPTSTSSGWSVDVTRSDLKAGVLRDGSSNTEWYGDQYIIHSAERSAGFAISSRAIHDFRAAATVSILGGQLDTSWAGIMYDPNGSGGAADGTVFFGKNHSTIRLFYATRGKFRSCLHEMVPVKPRRADRLEIIRTKNRYRFEFNGEEVATLIHPGVDCGIVEIVVGRYSIGAFKDWSVLTQGSD